MIGRMTAVEDQLAAALSVIREAVPADALLAVSLYGSAVAGGLRPDSDLDLFVVPARRLRGPEKDGLIQGLLPISGRDTRPASWRPLEVTVVALGDVRPWHYPPRWELQYGEWLRAEFLAGELAPGPPANPDLAILVTMVRQSGRPLMGPAASELLDPVPRADLVRAMTDELPSLLADLEPDTRNVLLTLARIWTTAVMGEIRSKDAAAAWAIERLAPEHATVLRQARDLYVDGGYGTWDMAKARAVAATMEREILRS
jgi:streptomycin 3"-adenylyltransferase